MLPDPRSSSSAKLSLDYIALYIIVAILSSSLTALPEASYSILGFMIILAFEAKI